MFVWNSEYPGLLRHQVWAIVLSEYERATNKRENINKSKRENEGVREVIPHVGLIHELIPVKLF